jgi:hypothetical protein
MGGRRVKIGDMFQILSRKGICFGQILHEHVQWGYIIGIFYDFPEQHPKDFKEYVNRRPDLITPFLINIAVSRGYFAVVDNVPVAAVNAKFPIFRGTNNPGEGDNTLWFFWDGKREWRVERQLTDEEKFYPEKSLPSAPLLIEYIEDGYRVEDKYL